MRRPPVPHRYRLNTLVICALIAQPVAAQGSGAVNYPAPSGPYPVGVRDFDFVDTEYPIDRETDTRGRRLMVRVWYPAASTSDARRRYFEGRELQVLAHPLLDALSTLFPNQSLLDPLADVVTHSYQDAPIARDLGPFPTLVFSHGGLSYVSQNAAIMEDLASHGYLSFSVTHPGGSSGVLFPDGDSVLYDADWRDAIISLVTDPDPDGRGSADVAKRYAAARRLVDDGGLGPWAQRWRDDMLALVDLIESGNLRGPAAEVISQADLIRLGYWGMSYGASAAVSAAQADPRAKAVVNFDGTHWLSDLLDTNVRVPLLVLSSEIGTYSNEFFFEPLATMGDRRDIVRLRIPEITHMELSDNMFLPDPVRAQFPGGGRADAQRVHAILTSFIRGFFDHHLDGTSNGYPDSFYPRFPEVQHIDVRHVKKGAKAR